MKYLDKVLMSMPYQYITYFKFHFRAEYGEKTVQKLNLRIDNIMGDLVTEKMKTQTVNDELDQTFELFVGNNWSLDIVYLCTYNICDVDKKFSNNEIIAWLSV